MFVREDSIQRPNIYSNKLLFEQGDNRNKKRIAQMLKRKTALSAKHGSKENGKNLSPIKSPIFKKDNNTENILKNNINQKNNLNKNYIDNSDYERDITNGIKLEYDIINDMKKNINCENNMINLDCSPIISNNNFFNENNYYNNSSTNNSNNNSLINRDSQEKEVNISNLDNDSIDDIIINKEDNQEEDCLNMNIENEKILSKSLYNYDQDDDHIPSKEERKIKEENEYALKYLTSSSDSFVQLDNHLVARAKAQGGEMTESYIQALFPDFMIDSNKPLKTKNYEVIDIIKEEREIDSPFTKTNFFSKINSKTNRISLDINLTLKNENSFNNLKQLKKSLTKAKSNVQLLNKENNKNKNKIDINININNNSLRNKRYKSISNFKSIKKGIKNNRETKRNKNEKLNISTSYVNIKMDKNKTNKFKLKIQSSSELNSTFYSNLYKKGNTGRSSIKNNKNNIKNSFTNLFELEDEQDDALIKNCLKKIGKNKNKKINKHYLKNINFYDQHKESDNNRKITKKRNKNENINNKPKLDSLTLTNSSNYNCLNTIDKFEKRKLALKKNNSKKKLNNNWKNYAKININTINQIKNTNKSFTHNICISSSSCNEHTKQKKYLTKMDRVKSSSRLIIKKNTIKDILNTESNLERTTTNHKKLNTITNDEYINKEASFMRIDKRRYRNNISNNIIIDKKKFLPIYKKIDYSYVKAKVETGLSEIILKKLLNNNKRLINKERNKKIETEKKESLFKKCKTSMNKTIENFKTGSSNIKNKICKNNNNKEINSNIKKTKRK